jgi:hypothetical protein
MLCGARASIRAVTRCALAVSLARRWFHTPFRADDWMLYHMQCLRLENNRGLCQGKIYTRDGRLAVSVCQEGVVRLSPKPFSFSAMLEEHRAKGDKGGAVSVEALAEAAAKGAPRSML